MSKTNRQTGFTLIELLIVIVIVAILLAVGLPSFGTGKDKRHLKGSANSIHQDLRFARAEAIKRNEQIRVTFKGIGATDWCYGMTTGEVTCDCEAADCVIDGVLRTGDSSVLGENDITLTAAGFAGGVAFTTIDPNHGTAGNGTVSLTSAEGVNVNVILSNLGRVRVCSPDAGNKYGFEDC